MAVKRSLISVWMRELNSSMLRRTAIAKSGNKLVNLRQVRGVEVVGLRRAQLEGADHAVLVVQRRNHQRAHAGGEHAVLDRRAARHRGEILPR